MAVSAGGNISSRWPSEGASGSLQWCHVQEGSWSELHAGIKNHLSGCEMLAADGQGLRLSTPCFPGQLGGGTGRDVGELGKDRQLLLAWWEVLREYSDNW